MAGFGDAKLWVQIAFILILFSTLLEYHEWHGDVWYGAANPVGRNGYGYGRYEGAQACHFIGFMSSCTALALSIMLIFAGKDDKILKIILTVFCFVAALFVIIGTGIQGDYIGYGKTVPFKIFTATMAFCFLMQVAAGIFHILDILGK